MFRRLVKSYKCDLYISQCKVRTANAFNMTAKVKYSSFLCHILYFVLFTETYSLQGIDNHVPHSAENQQVSMTTRENTKFTD